MKKVCLRSHVCPLLFLLAFIIACNGQSNSNALKTKDPALEARPKNDAQIDDYVVEVFEDKKGNLWFGTLAKGAARFDGKTLTYFSTKKAYVTIPLRAYGRQ
ncbi:MAG: hypothetical protein IPH31_17630 [Lewinellaceae bacterium]|nr:hypothetical protein [Lewinellaceae bacterium]